MEAAARKPPPSPRPGMFVAVALELGLVMVLAYEHSVVGLLLCAAYSWFSATWALLTWGK
jgi:hypothetical protein